ncbi:MAG: DinB family protein [Balneolaceae bacterium]|nr:DinB family protein [Balneolaceae bacterium]
MGKSYPASFEYFIQQFEKAIQSSQDFFRRIDETIFSLKPGKDQWSIGECYSHLIQTGNLYLEKVTQGMEMGNPGESQPENPLSLRLHMKWFVQYLEPPISVKSKAPGAFHPQNGSAIKKEEIVQDFLDQQNAFLKHLKTAQKNHIDLSSIKVSNPLLSFVGMTVAECIAVTEAHTRRHMEQAKRVFDQIS